MPQRSWKIWLTRRIRYPRGYLILRVARILRVSFRRRALSESGDTDVVTPGQAGPAGEVHFADGTDQRLDVVGDVPDVDVHTDNHDAAGAGSGGPDRGSLHHLHMICTSETLGPLYWRLPRELASLGWVGGAGRLAPLEGPVRGGRAPLHANGAAGVVAAPDPPRRPSLCGGEAAGASPVPRVRYRRGECRCRSGGPRPPCLGSGSGPGCRR